MNIPREIAEAINSFLENHHCTREDLRIYIPNYLANFIMGGFLTHDHVNIINGETKYLGVDVLEGYHKHIIVAHKFSALKNIEPIRIVINN